MIFPALHEPGKADMQEVLKNVVYTIEEGMNMYKIFFRNTSGCLQDKIRSTFSFGIEWVHNLQFLV